MRNPDRVLKYLRSKNAKGGCDECLAAKLRTTRREIAEACRRLSETGSLLRKKGKCPLGDHTRVLNSVAPLATSRRKSQRKAAAPRRPTSGGRDQARPSSAALGIEDAWRYVDRLCRAVWAKHLESDPPASLAEMISSLRDREILPRHEANMMHTIRSLRNFAVHENLDFGVHETTVARAAWEIVQTWAEQRERAAWRQTLDLCA